MISFAHIDTQLGPQAGDTQVLGFPLAVKYLEDRGIPPEFMVALGIRICLANDLMEAVLRKKCYDDRLAIVFPHFRRDGEAYDWWSCRLVESAPRPPGALKRAKMFCPPGEPPVAYLPYTLDWERLKRGDKVYIHESAIKAANGARLGRWSIGLNGVRGWSSRKHGLALIEGLADLPWRTMALQPVIVFDSNTADNEDVRDARTRLASKLLELTGQRAVTIELPKTDDGKDQGFDDYCVRMGDAAALALLDGETSEIEISEYETALFAMNDKVVFVESISRVVEIDTGVQMTKASFTDMNYATTTIADEDGERRNFPRMWLTDERRASVKGMVYAPGEDKVGENLNLWNGMGVEPAAGDVSRWLAVLERGIPDAELRKWVLQWFAWPLQNLGGKMTTYIHMFGPSGTGKNALLVPLLRIYGENGIQINKERVESDFNALYATKQFVNLDEIHGGNEKGAEKITNKIKFLTTTPRLPVNAKGAQEYLVDNHINLVTTSNYSDSIKLDEGDRRACVVQFGTRDGIVRDKEYWIDYHAWADSAEGAAAVYDYLLRVNCEDFAPQGWAPHNEWKDIVTDSTKGPMEKWVRALWEDADEALPPLMQGAKVLSNDQLAVAYMPEESNKITPGLKNALGQRMQECGFKRTGNVKIDGRPVRLWIIADRDVEWTNEMLRTEFVKGTNRFGKSKF